MNYFLDKEGEILLYGYLLTTRHHSLFYTGVTNDLESRTFEHKIKLNRGFTSKYNCTKLVYYEEFQDILEAIRREKVIKRYKRAWKRNLVNSMNPDWKDLSEGWYDLSKR